MKSTVGIIIAIILCIILFAALFRGSRLYDPSLEIGANLYEKDETKYYTIFVLNNGEEKPNTRIHVASECELSNQTYHGCKIDQVTLYQSFISCNNFPHKAMIYIGCKDPGTDIIVFNLDTDLHHIQHNFECVEENCISSIQVTQARWDNLIVESLKVYKQILPNFPSSG